MLRKYIQENTLITDGAMGTYYCQVTGRYGHFSEMENINDPEIIKNIHKQYIASGAKLIRTNTFSANRVTLDTSREVVREILKRGYHIGLQAAAGNDVYVAASIGPIPEAGGRENPVGAEDNLEAYRDIVDTLLEEGASIFVFETFSSTEYLGELSKYIKEKNPSAFVLTQFAITAEGFTRKGISAERLVREVKAVNSIDAFGFNCGIGPTHLYNFLRKFDITQEIVSVLPNAGYPEVVNERTLYVQNPEYFADVMLRVKGLGARILGGCCGTTPSHIRRMADILGQNSGKPFFARPAENRKAIKTEKELNSFHEKMKQDKFVVAVELDPPFDISMEKILHSAKVCKENKVDIVTIADSPMARARVDSILIASKIKREIGIETMPHLCCRDRNLNAIKSGLMGAHIEGIRNVLAVTGDPVPEAHRSEIKSVFNLNSMKLIEFIEDMNKELFHEEQLFIGGALNLNALNKDVELQRMFKKAAKGAGFFLTQPVFDDDVIEYLSGIQRDKNIKILGGIMPVVSYKNAQFLNNEIPGIHIPQQFIERFTPEMTREEAEETGIQLAVEIAGKMRGFVDGLYFITPFNRIEMIMKIIKRISGEG